MGERRSDRRTIAARGRPIGFAVALLAASGCGGPPKVAAPEDGGAGGGPGRAPPQTLALVVTAVDPTFVTEDHFIASLEMQLSGEPLAEAMGRNLLGYRRDYACQEDVCQASRYGSPAPRGRGAAEADPGRIDLAGFASAIESYEYSKQPMNEVAFESGAGTSLLFGPVLNPRGATGAAALALAGRWFHHLASRTALGGAFIQDGSPLGWKGLWPVLQPFAS
ncbi:MAG TPA: hypothetical protein VHO06_02460, partial [Polyangia bacterium]|nr:hypothetical protein [Polyangia bacterium]